MTGGLPVRISFHIIASVLMTARLAFANEPELKDQKSKLSYVVGLQAGQLIKSRQTDVNEEVLKAGIDDGLNGKKPRLNESEVKELLASIDNDFQEKRAADRKAAGEKNALEGPKFLAENKIKEGVITTPSGLQYLILHEGDGPIPKESDRVVINFIGMSTDGKEFENTYKSGHAETVFVNRMIMGWREALLMMKSGSKYRLFVPANLAFGTTGAGAVAPNAALIFDLELLGVVPIAPSPAGARNLPKAAASPEAR